MHLLVSLESVLLLLSSVVEQFSLSENAARKEIALCLTMLVSGSRYNSQ